MLLVNQLTGFGVGVGGSGPPAADNVMRSPSNMTSDSSPSPFVSAASSVYSGGYEAYKVFDGDPGGSWASSTSSGWVSIDLGASYWLAKYEVRSRQLNQDHDPKTWTFQGSTDNSNWTTVDTQTNYSWPGAYTLASFTISSGSRINARYWRFNCSVSWGALVIIQELKLYT